MSVVPLTAQQHDERARQLLRAPIHYAAIESVASWRKLFLVALAQRWPQQFASLAVPAIYAELLAEQFSSQGFEARLTERFQGASGEERCYLTLWLPPKDRQGSQQPQQEGAA